ncbi:MAG: AAA family ATPase [Gudongella sp.]|jgi:chromosome segregation ATPase|nr:AAA family ATPase [Gudongella sp.]
MKITELNLMSFGKFSNKIIRLQGGLNLIYGYNESGKSTINGFIEGMLYGFIKPNLRTTKYTEDHLKYTPWRSSLYEGQMTLSRGDTSYKVYRNFTKGVESLKVFDEITGEDITNKIRLGNSNRVLQPGFEFFEVDSGVFGSTVYVKQGDIATDESLAQELKNRLTNAASSGEQSISVVKALEKLNGKLKEIGTERALNSKYGLIYRKTEDLEKRISEIKKTKEIYQEASNSYSVLSEEIAKLENAFRKNKHELDIIRILERKEKLERMKVLESEILVLQSKGKTFGEFCKVDEETLINCRDLNFQAALLEKQITDLTVNISSTEENLKNNNFQEGELTGFEKEKDRINQGIQSNVTKSRWVLFATVLAVITYLAVTLYGFATGKYIMVAAAQGLLLLVAFMIYTRLLINKAVEAYNQDFKKIDDIIKTREAKNIEITNVLTNLIEKRESENKQLEEINTEMTSVLNEFKINTLQELEESFKATIELQSLEKEISLLEREYNKIKEECEEEKIVLEDSSAFIEEAQLESGSLSKAELLMLNKTLIEEREYTSFKLRELDGKISVYGEQLHLLQEYEEERERLYNQLDNLNFEKEAITIARDRIKELSTQVHREYAPEINKKISHVMGRLTGGLHSTVRIDSELNIKIEDIESGRILQIDDLSSGTTDQLYMALRMGIFSKLIPDDAPIFLDESFAQYDEERLGNAIKFIGEESVRRQIVLFTCQKREKEILDKQNIRYNYIEL